MQNAATISSTLMLCTGEQYLTEASSQNTSIVLFIKPHHSIICSWTSSSMLLALLIIFDVTEAPLASVGFLFSQSFINVAIITSSTLTFFFAGVAEELSFTDFVMIVPSACLPVGSFFFFNFLLRIVCSFLTFVLARSPFNSFVSSLNSLASSLSSMICLINLKSSDNLSPLNALLLPCAIERFAFEINDVSLSFKNRTLPLK